MKDLRMTDFLKCDLRHEQAKFGWCYDIIINIGWINKCKKTVNLLEREMVKNYSVYRRPT